MQDIDGILSIIRKKNNDLFNQIIKAIGEGDYSKWESSCHKMSHLREFESRLTLISVQIHSIRLEVEEIAQQVDQI